MTSAEINGWLWTGAVANGVIAACSCIIAALILYFLRRRPDMRPRRAAGALAILFFFDAIGHLGLSLSLFPPHWAALWSVATAVAAAALAVAVVARYRAALEAPSTDSLNAANIRLEAAQAELTAHMAEQNRLGRRLIQAEQEARRAAIQLATIVESSADAILVIDAGGLVRLLNPAAERMFGRGAEELLGAAAAGLMDAALIALGPQRPQEGWGRRGDLLFPIAVDASPLEEGAVALTCRDLTERRRADEAMRLLSGAVEHGPAMVVVTDGQGVIRYVNPRFCDISGYSSAEALGQRVSMMKSGRTPPETYAEMWDTLHRGAVWRGEFHNRRKDGGYYWVAASIAPVADADGRATLYVAVEDDISGRKTLEAEMSAAREAAEAANRAKSAFLASMSHELRTPMNAILGFANLMEAEVGGALSESHREYVGQIRRAGDHLMELIDQVLDLAKIEAGSLSLQVSEVSANDLCDECAALAKPLAIERGLNFRNDAEALRLPHILADFTRAKQVLLNFLSNAIKYNRDQGLVALSAERVMGDWLRISVADDGHGVPEERSDELFRPFSRLGAEDSDVEGAGIGLVIAKQLAEAMGGHIGFASRAGSGSVFWLDLPIAEAAAPAAAPAFPTAAAPVFSQRRPRTVLYVEDNPASVDLMRETLRLAPGVAMISAPNGEDGVAAAIRQQPDAVLMDVNLPGGLSGLAAARRLKATPETQNIPLIGLSASAMPEEVARGMAAGFRAYLTKPFRPDDLLHALGAAFAERDQRRDDAP